jgi:serine/threonine protein kinase
MFSWRTADYAVKFFLQREVFEREAELYQNAVLRAMMPATVEICANANGEHTGPSGFAFPPFIVIERGESLIAWQLNNFDEELDMTTALQTLSHIAKRLKLMHDAGWVNMDLKPSNVLRLLRRHAWTLIDFGCAAQAGAPVSTFTPSSPSQCHTLNCRLRSSF